VISAPVVTLLLLLIFAMGLALGFMFGVFVRTGG
jgi:hypothetical protein